MARRKSRPLPLMRDLSPAKQSARRYAKRLGFSNERAYKNWVSKWTSVPQSDPRWFDNKLRGNRRAEEIRRLKAIQRKIKSPAQAMYRKMQAITQETKRMSAFDFYQKYIEMILAILNDPETSARDKALMRRLLRELREQMAVSPAMLPGYKEGMLL